MNLERQILTWMANGDVGSSSKAMALTAVDIRGSSDHPYDTSDFHRCLLLLDAIPEIRLSFDKLAKLSKTWALLIERWDELEKTFLEEAGLNWSKGYEASKTLELIRGIRDQAAKQY